MAEKILSLEKLTKEELRTINNSKLKKIYNDLRKLNFLDNRNFAEGDKMIFYILKLNPTPNEMDGKEYLRKDYLKNNECVKSKLYDFDLRTISTMP